MIFQDPLSAMHPYYTVGNQIAEAYRVHNDVTKKAARARTIEMLDRVGIPQPNRQVDQYPHQFSGGMRQRAMHRDDPGAAISRQARQWLAASWKGASFMAVGGKDPVLGVPVMNELRKSIRGCPQPLVVANGGHFLQEWGEEVAAAAAAHWS